MMEIYKRLKEAFDFYNSNLFDSRLPDVVFTLQRIHKVKGSYSSSRYISEKLDGKNINEIALNPDYFGMESSRMILQTIVHEMCHMFVDINGKHVEKGYHDRTWVNLMKKNGLQPSSTGQEGGRETGFAISQYEIKDGLFSKKTDELLSTGWRIEWYDRYHIKNVKDNGVVGNKKTSNGKKYKYFCGCSIVWGKSGLQLMCSKCKNVFVCEG